MFLNRDGSKTRMPSKSRSSTCLSRSPNGTPICDLSIKSKPSQARLSLYPVIGNMIMFIPWHMSLEHSIKRLDSPSSYAAFVHLRAMGCLNTGVPTSEIKFKFRLLHFEDFNSYSYLFIFYNAIFFLPTKRNQILYTYFGDPPPRRLEMQKLS